MESMYHAAGLLLLEIRTQLEQLEANTGGDNARIAGGQLAANINALSRAAAELEENPRARSARLRVFEKY